MRKLLLILVAGVVLLPTVVAQTQAPKTLDVYFIDADGGKATLYVSPTGESLMYDVGGGPAGANARDLPRVLAALKEAKVKALDHVIISHYHADHVGTLGSIMAQVPVRTLYDHGPGTDEVGDLTGPYDEYLPIRKKFNVIVPKVGDKISVGGVEVQIISSNKELLTKPMAGAPGAGAPNPLCRDFVPKEETRPNSDNLNTIGVVVRYGNFRVLDLSDLTWNLEKAMVCPNNLIGAIDVYQTTRHGQHSGPPVMVHAVRPRVAVMNNSNTKGGFDEVFKIVRGTPGLQDFWQIHRSENVPKEVNSPDQFIANFEAGNAKHVGYYIKVSARPDGSFTVTNQRTGFSKHYPAAITGSR